VYAHLGRGTIHLGTCVLVSVLGIWSWGVRSGSAAAHGTSRLVAVMPENVSKIGPSPGTGVVECIGLGGLERMAIA